MADEAETIGDDGAQRLWGAIQRIEALHLRRKDLGDDVKVEFATLKASGFDVPAVRAVLVRRRAGEAKHTQLSALQETYWRAIEPMLADELAAIEAAASIAEPADAEYTPPPPHQLHRH